MFRKRGKGPERVADSPIPSSRLRHPFQGKRLRLQSIEWTDRLATLADRGQSGSHGNPSSAETEKLEAGDALPDQQRVNVSLRLEGPYFSPADPSRYGIVVCLVAGTGISGAVAIAAAFNERTRAEHERNIDTNKPLPKPQWRRCIIVWSVKATDDIPLPFIEPRAQGLELRRFRTGPGYARVDLRSELTELAKGGERTWVYVSGPNAFIDAGQEACLAVKRVRGVDLDFYCARWDI